MTLSNEHMATGFLPNQEFRPLSGTSAPRTAGCRRMGCGQVFQVGCGILVSVMYDAARWTGPFSDRQRERINHSPAVGTRFRRPIPTVGHYHRGVRQGRFVDKLTSNFSHRSVYDGFRQSGADHSLDTQILDSDDSKIADNLCRHLMTRVLADVGNLQMHSLDLGLRLLPVLASLRATRQFLVEPSQLGFVPSQNTGCLDLGSVRKDGEIADPKVYPHRCLGFTAVRVGPFGFIDLNLNRDIPVPCALDESGRQRLTGEAKLFTHSYPAKLGNAHFTTVKGECTAFDAEGILCTPLFFELRIAWFLALLNSAKEMLERRAEIRQRCVGDPPRHLVQPSEVALLTGIQFSVECLPRTLLPSFKQPIPPTQAPVPRKSCRASAALKPRPLDIVKVESDSVGKDSHLVFLLMNFCRAIRMISPSETPRRLASSLSQALSGGSKWISRRILRFMYSRITTGTGAVKNRLWVVWVTASISLELSVPQLSASARFSLWY